MPENAKEEAKEKLVWLARTGYCTRGVVYMLVGVLAVLAAFGEGGKTTDSKGALLTVMSSPFGGVMIAIIIVGLFGYALWRLVQAINDTDGHGRDVKGLAIRGGILDIEPVGLRQRSVQYNLFLEIAGGIAGDGDRPAVYTYTFTSDSSGFAFKHLISNFYKYPYPSGRHYRS